MSNSPYLLAQKACEARLHAYAPYSKYPVGACVQAEDGSLFIGCNVENVINGLSICAEMSAICALIAAGKRKITALAVVGSGDILCSPCGACRQVIREFAAPDTPVYLCDAQTQKVMATTNIAALFPQSFGPDNLQHDK